MFLFTSIISSQVLWLGQTESSSTWVPAEALPPTAIATFEKGLSSDIVEHCQVAYGEHRNTLVTSTEMEKSLKKCRITRPTVESSSG